MIERGAIAALGLSILAHVALLGADPFEVRAVGPAVAAERAPPMVLVDISAFRPPPPEPQAVPAVAEAPEPVAPVPVVKPKPVPKPRPAPLAALSAERLPVVEETVVDVLAADAVPDDEVQTHADPLPETLAAAGAGLLPQPQGEVFSIDGWPTHGAIVFRVFLGDKGLQVGEARHEWSHDGSRYSMQVVLETTGVAALLKGFHYVQRSEGQIMPEGLRPDLFSVTQRGKAQEVADFDWVANRVSIRRGDRERRAAALQAGDQDVLSLWHQIGIVGTAGLPRTLLVVSNKDAESALLEAVGEEGLRLPIGRLETLRLRAQAEDGKLTIDIWLARNYGMLPVRIRMVDDKGEVLDQQAVQLRLAPPDRTPGEPAPRAEMIELKEEVPAFPVADLYIN